jgi:hypothetical protein
MMSRKIEGCNSCEFYNSDNYDRSFHGFVSIDRLKEQLVAAEDKLLQEVDAIDHGIDKLLDLYQNNLIGKAKFAERIQPLNRHKQEILEKLEAMRAAEGA